MQGLNRLDALLSEMLRFTSLDYMIDHLEEMGIDYEIPARIANNATKGEAEEAARLETLMKRIQHNPVVNSVADDTVWSEI